MREGALTRSPGNLTRALPYTLDMAGVAVFLETGTESLTLAKGMEVEPLLRCRSSPRNSLASSSKESSSENEGLAVAGYEAELVLLWTGTGCVRSSRASSSSESSREETGLLVLVVLELLPPALLAEGVDPRRLLLALLDSMRCSRASSSRADRNGSDMICWNTIYGRSGLSVLLFELDFTVGQ